MRQVIDEFVLVPRGEVAERINGTMILSETAAFIYEHLEEAIKVRDKKENTVNEQDNPLGYEKESKLLVGFAIPCIISMLVTALYNIVDQIFIGQGVGMLGNAATNIAFPLSTSCTAISLLLGIGSATNFSLKLGAGEEKESAEYAGNGICLMAIFGIALFAVTTIFLTPMLKFFGATSEVLPYAQEYTRITAIGFPFLIANTGMSKLILADGSPRYSMTSMLVGAIVNTILDPIFIFVLDMGIKGAAIATVISQILSALLVFYFLHGKSELKVRWIHINEISECTRHARDIISLGSAGFIMQLTNSLVSICCNNVLSVTGGDIYISVMTIISSVRQMVETPIHAINEGTSPVLSYNYGARRPDRVKKAGVVLIIMVLIYTGIMWSVILIAPEFLIGIFSSDKLLLKDAVPALKLYFAAFIFMDLQYIGQTVFKSLNKKKQSIFFSLLRKVFIVVPLTYFLPYGLHMGTDGVFMAEPVSNVIGGSLCFITMLVTILPELNKMGNSR